MPQKLHCWDLVLATLSHLPRLLLYGVPGTGKTRQALSLALRRGQAVYSLTLTEETPAAELRGHYVPVDGQFCWRDGPALAAFRNGSRLVLNEIDHASEDALTFLLAVLDDPETACITLPTGETVRPAPGFTVVATSNQDPSVLPLPLLDRFVVAIHIDAVHPDALATLPPDLRAAALSTVALPPERRVSIRAWQAFARLREHMSEEVAARIVFGDRAGDVLDALRLSRK